MKPVKNQAYRLSLVAALMMGFVLVVLVPTGAWASRICKRDPHHTLQQLIDKGGIGSDHIPWDIHFQPIQGIWKNTTFTEAFYWPVVNEEFGTFGITCPISCNYRIQPTCEVTTPAGITMLAFRDKYGELLYVLKDHFEPVPRKEKKERP